MIVLKVVGILLLLIFALLSLVVFLQRRSDKRRLVEMRAELQRKTEAGINPFDDGFYCFMLKDGTCRSGYIERSPAE
ncbi:hypothetical protein [Pseudomonas sp. GOM6]|uniref:hypothetical protein n=1 Tax=Pseudomonas sp. GOM6 TaxID=3036944 RepID=UPI00240A3AB9|nr:hypothetical protein [Pseudomonas sp. GOM6]MDG1581272.1 hypothetical protein [Pseudomonas sp. GOM6]